MARAHESRAAVDRFLAGDDEVVADTLRAIRAAVATRGFYIPNDERAEVVSETMINLLQQLRDPRRERPDSLEAFARTVAYRRCVDWMRRHRPADELPERLAGGASPERELLAAERVELGRRVLGELDETCRELIRLRAHEGRSFATIAAARNQLEKTVRNRLYKCLDRARLALRRLERRDRLAVARPRGSGS